jgi:alpha-1,2-rhamnosyltransferase
VADDLRSHLAKGGGSRLPAIDHFYLGAGLDTVDPQGKTLDTVTQAFANRGAPVYLTVGTIEPRKNHELILDAFDRLWAGRAPARLVIFGRLGWRSDALARRIRDHAELGRRLMWFETGSDTELDYAYRHASALIFASCSEGFGLPLVEAMQYGLPVLASDIPVFREIGTDYPTYFPLEAPRSLDAALGQIETLAEHGKLAPRAARPWLSWSQSARMLLEKVTGATGETPDGAAGRQAARAGER